MRRLINAVAGAAIRVGLGPRHLHMLTVTGRRTRTPRSTPVALVERGADSWLVAPYGEVAWVRNAREAGVVELARAGRHERYVIRTVESDEAGEVLKSYVALEPITLPFFDAVRTDAAARFAAEAERHPVFKLHVVTSLTQ